jgi:hypothetical protein
MSRTYVIVLIHQFLQIDFVLLIGLYRGQCRSSMLNMTAYQYLWCGRKNVSTQPRPSKTRSLPFEFVLLQTLNITVCSNGHYKQYTMMEKSFNYQLTKKELLVVVRDTLCFVVLVQPTLLENMILQQLTLIAMLSLLELKALLLLCSTTARMTR